MPARPIRRTALLAGASALLLAAALPGLGPSTAGASSHREAPMIAGDPTVDNTDLYAFVSPDKPDSVTLIASFAPFSAPDGGPNFFPFATDAAYNIHVDNDGDAKADLTYRFTFKTQDRRGKDTFLYNNGPVTSLDDENLLFRQTYTLELKRGWETKTLIKDAPVAPSRVGKASMPDYNALRQQAIKALPGGGQVFAGQADDSFFLDLHVFDLLYGGDLSETGTDTLATFNVNSLAIQIPAADLALKGDATRNPVIGVWSTTDRGRVRLAAGDDLQGERGEDRGGRVQVSRLGNPLVNEVVVPAGLKDSFNASWPERDAKTPELVKRVTEPEVPRLIEAIYKIPAPATPRNDLVEIFLTGITTKAGGPIKADLNSQLNNADVPPKWFQPAEELRLNMSVKPAAKPNRLGVLAGDLQGFPNGRRLTDDVVDIELQALEGAAQTGKLVDALAAGDKVDANDQAFGSSFPYLALPNTSKVGGTAPAAKPASAQDTDTQSVALNTAEAGDPKTWRTIAYVTGAVGVAAVIALAAFITTAWWRRRRSRYLVS